MDMERARREGWFFGAKLVRGAYMVRAGVQCTLKLCWTDTVLPCHATCRSCMHTVVEWCLIVRVSGAVQFV